MPVSKVLQNVPDVYFDFLWPNKDKYLSYISVNVSAVKVPIVEVVEQDPVDLFEIEEIDHKIKT